MNRSLGVINGPAVRFASGSWKAIWLAGLAFFLAVRLAAQPNVPVKLALITESAAAQPAADLLTASFSNNSQIQLLERDQIEKVYHEQALAAGNTDYLKLGRLLGADGLLLLEVVATPQATNLTTRLIAVKPGVILNSATYGWPLPEITQWADLAARRVDGFLPKLTVLPKEAIPLSVVNLRSAISSAAGAETEKELKLQTIQRLSAERQLFVTEREKLQAAAEEKGLAGDETAFWNGSYLLEGVIDQNGYSAETITINARLTPPKGGEPVLLAVSGSRTNLTPVVNALALKVVAALSVQPTATVWSPADEAAQYFAEAQWALHWKLPAELQAAADSAWALGRHDQATLMLRAYARLAQVWSQLLVGQNPYLQQGQVPESLMGVRLQMMRAAHLPMAAKSRDRTLHDDLNLGDMSRKAGDLVLPSNPEGRHLAMVGQALDLYYQFGRTAVIDTPKMCTYDESAGMWKYSDWFLLGMDGLTLASRLLQESYFSPQRQTFGDGQLAELRALCRSVAEQISQAPSVHESYFNTNQVGIRNGTFIRMNPPPDLFRTELQWGRFWQESPRDCLALYRDLMSGPGFPYIHTALWSQDSRFPRLVDWSTPDQAKHAKMWADFERELAASTNVLWQMEAQALIKAEAKDEPARQAALAAWQSIVNAHSGDWAAWQAPLYLQDWGLTFDPQATRATPKLTPIPSQGHVYPFPMTFPHPPPAGLPPGAPGFAPEPGMMPRGDAVLSPDTNALPVTHHVAIPPELLKTGTNPFNERIDGLVYELQGDWNGRPWFEVRYHDNFYLPNAPARSVPAQSIPRLAVAILNPANDAWTIIPTPQTESFGLDNTVGFTGIFQDRIYYGEAGGLRWYDLTARHWEKLAAPWELAVQLQAVAGRFYAVNSYAIFEILNRGATIRVLASTRRQPAVTALDAEGDLGYPKLFASPENSLCALINGHVYGWDSHDWHQRLSGDYTSVDELNGTIVLRAVGAYPGEPNRLWLWEQKQATPTLALYETHTAGPQFRLGAPMTAPAPGPESSTESPLWNDVARIAVTKASTVGSQSNFYFFCCTPKPQPSQNVPQIETKMACFSRAETNPVLVSLNFDLRPEYRAAPITRMGFDLGTALMQRTKSTWFRWIGDDLYLDLPGTSGIWRIPVAQLETAVERQVKISQAEQAAAGRENADRLAKFDLNHNGIIDPDEREAALVDPEYIRSQLDVIDANHNDRLDAAELAWFDANTNGILDGNEQVGIALAQHALAARLLAKYDENGNGRLDMMEVRRLQQDYRMLAGQTVNEDIAAPGGLPPPVDVSKLEWLLKLHTDIDIENCVRKLPNERPFHFVLYPNDSIGGYTFAPNRKNDIWNGIPPAGVARMRLEVLWQNPDGITNDVLYIRDPQYAQPVYSN